jgi:hypothetical protein
MRFIAAGRMEMSLYRAAIFMSVMVSTHWLAGSSAAAGAIKVRAIATPSSVTLTGGNLVLAFADDPSLNATTLDRIDQITWSGGSGAFTGMNLIPAVSSGFCSDPTEFFGEAYGTPAQSGTPTPAIVVPGSAAVASLQTGTAFTSSTSGLDCHGNALADATASTAYAVYPSGDPNENEFRVARTINFSAQTPLFATNYLRAYVPMILPLYGIINYPNAAGTAIDSKDSTECAQQACEIKDWNGQWFAEDDDSGDGMVVFRDASSNSPAELFIQFDPQSFNDLTSIALLQPTGGWKAPITEVEWVCFYDRSTWSYEDQRAGNLPQGCAQAPAAAPDTTPDAFTFTAVTGIAPKSLQTSNSVSISGINAPAPSSIVGGSYSVNGGAFTTAAGSIHEGDTIAVQGTASASFSATTSVTLTVGGINSTFDVTTAPPPPVVSDTLNGHAGGGGGIDLCVLLGLAALAMMRFQSVRKVGAFVLLNAAILGSASLRAEESNSVVAGYVGIRAGVSEYQFSPVDLDKALGTATSQIDSESISRHQFGGSLYGGAPIYRNLMLELSYAEFGRFPLSVRTTTTDAAVLAQRAVRALQPAGHGVTAGFALPVELTALLSIEPRVSALFYESKQDLSTPTATYEDKEHGFGVDAGLSFAVRIAKPLSVGIGVDCVHMTQACNVLILSAQLEYRFTH